MEQIGSQTRLKIEDSEYKLIEDLKNGEVILLNTKLNRKEIWFENNYSAGFVIEIDGKGYEFACSLD